MSIVKRGKGKGMEAWERRTHVERMLAEKDMSSMEVFQAFKDLDPEITQQAISNAITNTQRHIVNWVVYEYTLRGRVCHRYAPVYRAGAGEDKPRPAPLQESRKYPKAYQPRPPKQRKDRTFRKPVQKAAETTHERDPLFAAFFRKAVSQ